MFHPPSDQRYWCHVMWNGHHSLKELTPPSCNGDCCWAGAHDTDQRLSPTCPSKHHHGYSIGYLYILPLHRSTPLHWPACNKCRSRFCELSSMTALRPKNSEERDWILSRSMVATMPSPHHDRKVVQRGFNNQQPIWKKNVSLVDGLVVSLMMV